MFNIFKKYFLKLFRSTSPSSLHSPSTTNTSSSGGNGMRENTVDQFNPQYQQPQLQTFLQQSPNHQPLQQQQVIRLLKEFKTFYFFSLPIVWLQVLCVHLHLEHPRLQI